MPTTLSRQQVIILLSIATGVLLTLLVLVRSCTGSGLGEPCGRQIGGCQLGLTCVARQCVPRCQDDADCPEGMTCGITELSNPERLVDTAPIFVCLRAREAERQVQRSVAAGDSDRMAMNRKRSEVYAEVQKLLEAGKWSLTEEAFDEAWARLPEEVRKERPEPALAELILTTAGTPLP